MNACCDYIYIYDQASTDGSKEFYKNYTKTVVIESETNDFMHERRCKDDLLKKLREEHPDCDWVLQADGDIIIDGRLIKNNGNRLREICDITPVECGFISVGHLNLWRSDIHYRVDSQYHCINEGGIICLWRFNKDLHFPRVGGLHGSPTPIGITGVEHRHQYYYIHRGFATDERVMAQYDMYYSHGQRGWDLERLMHEDNNLDLRVVPEEVLPEWFEIKDTVPATEKERIRSIYQRSH